MASEGNGCMDTSDESEDGRTQRNACPEYTLLSQTVFAGAAAISPRCIFLISAAAVMLSRVKSSPMERAGD